MIKHAESSTVSEVFWTTYSVNFTCSLSYCSALLMVIDKHPQLSFDAGDKVT